jgi:uncharacterized protein (TIGR00255 family)
MTLSSMTGFSRDEGEWGDYRWAWELRSVNARNLDIRIRVPSHLDGVEAQVRKLLSARFKRGSIQVGLHLKKHESGSEIAINPKALAEVLSAIDKLKLEVEAAPPTLDGILALRGVIDTREIEESQDDKAKRIAALISSFEKAADDLLSARDQEGANLEKVLSGQIDSIDQLTSEAAKLADEIPSKIQNRITSQIDELLKDRAGLSEERLAQEVAFLATKADIREELDRLVAHVEAAKDLFVSDEAVGRKLDCLTQEFNREANTLCSKAADVGLTRIGLELKAVVDQMREQVQNIE